MDPRRVLIFRTVARAGSISAGARELGWTQPAVSQHLSALEREAGQPLLLRGATGVTPTEAGRLLLAEADAVAAHLDAATQQLAHLADARGGTVRIAAFPSGLAVPVPRAVADLARRRPGVRVELTDAEPPEALALVRAGEVDLALVFGYPEQRDADPFVRLPLGVDPVRLVTTPDAPAPASIAELTDADWVAGCERCRRHLVQVCEAAGFVPRIRHVTDDAVVVQSLVSLGLACALLPETALIAHRNPGVAVVDLPELGARELAVVHRAGAERVPAVAALIGALHRAAAAR